MNFLKTLRRKKKKKRVFFFFRSMNNNENLFQNCCVCCLKLRRLRCQLSRGLLPRCLHGSRCSRQNIKVFSSPLCSEEQLFAVTWGKTHTIHLHTNLKLTHLSSVASVCSPASATLAYLYSISCRHWKSCKLIWGLGCLKKMPYPWWLMHQPTVKEQVTAHEVSFYS